MSHSLEVYNHDCLVFWSDGTWLHPLFELEDFVTKNGIDPSGFSIVDSIIGRAAAILIIRMGIRTVHGKIVSALAVQTFSNHGIIPTFDTLVDRITCKTEELLEENTDIQCAYEMLKDRAVKARSGS